ncbi:hypothetical protein KDD30_10475 [Photobacterium sp. GJ3]|uniref:hypothetical protein n=1 Tax=Photobacterium sp. GJ3 TaxID=2829502 RepID=UPI001B8D4F2F|nr:hypothetical protein [Photobacterium sp. GJ3]QUJ66586.1 hypothetical protein KDD30_10475 [Photobacterium sp. GJ3]
MASTAAYNTYESLLNPNFRNKIDDLLVKFEQVFYEKVENADKMLDESQFSMDLYKRHNIETILRIALKRAVDPLIANYWATRDPQLCKEWGLYGAEEGRHDRMFARDLHAVGVTDEEIYSTKPTFATELLNGYFYYTMAVEDPLASMVSGFYLEYMASKTQPDWLDRMEKHVGKEKTTGARAHLQLDIDEDHTDMVWNSIMRIIKTHEDEQRFIEHLTKIHALFCAYFVEVYDTSHQTKKDDALNAAVAPIAAVKIHNTMK